MEKTALLVGATGLVGRALLAQLLDAEDYAQVITLSRRRIDLQHARLRQVVCDFDEMALRAPELSAEDVYCCLGTTLRQAGDKARFPRVDYYYVMQLATVMRQHVARHLILLSALGASERSLFFYSRVKGRLERDLIQLNYPCTSIFRPSLLLGERANPRLQERWAGRALSVLSPLIRGPLTDLRPVPAAQLAQAMFAAGRRQACPCLSIYASRDILSMAKIPSFIEQQP